jgi:CHASE3 domain sensor protein
LVALSVYGYLQTNQLLDSQKWVNHTNKVVLALNKISSEFNEATSNRRGYLLTGDSTMLTSRETNYNAINLELDLVDSLTKDNPEQILL